MASPAAEVEVRSQCLSHMHFVPSQLTPDAGVFSPGYEALLIYLNYIAVLLEM